MIDSTLVTGTSADTLPPAVRARLASELQPGERIRWAAQPSVVRMLARQAGTIVFMLVWLVVPVFVAHQFIAGHVWDQAGPFVLIPAVMVLAGVGTILSKLLLALRALRTAYVITDRRALVLEAGLRQRCESYVLERLAAVELQQHGAGYGNLVLAREEYRDARNIQRTRDRGFLACPDVASAWRLVQPRA